MDVFETDILAPNVQLSLSLSCYMSKRGCVDRYHMH